MPEKGFVCSNKHCQDSFNKKSSFRDLATSAWSPVANQLDDAIIDQTEGHNGPSREAHHHHQTRLDHRHEPTAWRKL